MCYLVSLPADPWGPCAVSTFDLATFHPFGLSQVTGNELVMKRVDTNSIEANEEYWAPAGYCLYAIGGMTTTDSDPCQFPAADVRAVRQKIWPTLYPRFVGVTQREIINENRWKISTCTAWGACIQCGNCPTRIEGRSSHFARGALLLPQKEKAKDKEKEKEKEKKKASIVWGVACHQLNGSREVISPTNIY